MGSGCYNAAPMRIHVVLLALLCSGCAMFEDGLPFQPIGDLKTSQRESLSEGGHGEEIMPPAGLVWSQSLTGTRQHRRTEVLEPCYRWTFQLSDQRPAGAPAVMPRFEQARLVDDEGRSFRAGRLQLLVDGKARPGRAAVRQWVVEFPVPSDYRFHQISRTTIHWTLATDGAAAMAISSRFRQ